MARLNTARRLAEVTTEEGRTHGGALAVRVGNLASLRRSVLATLLNERQFYEDGEEIFARINRLALECDPVSVARLAVEARKEHGLRHAPLALLVALTRTGKGSGLVADTIEQVVSRADEVGELVAMYWADGGRRPLSVQLKKGLARAIGKFDEYQLAKYASMDADVRLRDVMFMVHPRPAQGLEAVYEGLANRTLGAPDTWEVALSRGADKRETFERLIREGRLGYLALLRNLRGMQEAGVDEKLVIDAILARKGAKGVLPFQFLGAAEQAPRYAVHVEAALLANVKAGPKLKGKTIIIGDASGSMGNAKLSGKSQYTRLDGQSILMGLLVAMCEDPVVYATAGSDWKKVHDTRRIAAREGLGMVEVMRKAAREQGGGGIFLTQTMDFVREQEKNADRTIVLTDEQDCDTTGHGAPAKADAFGTRNYLINVASAKNGIGYRKWTHVDGFSEAVLKWIPAFEASEEEDA